TPLKAAVETAVKWRAKKKALSLGTVRIKHFFAQKIALGTLWGGGVAPQNFPNSKFFPKIFQRYRSANQNRTFFKKGTPKTFHSPLRRSRTFPMVTFLCFQLLGFVYSRQLLKASKRR
ncbi:hypothetical protein, partial [Enterococcus faecium]|uniref:hypothetical protein n=1 Tax=Enterococcus faecium TaxID=1352 RepID=UPI00159ED8D5